MSDSACVGGGRPVPDPVIVASVRAPGVILVRVHGAFGSSALAASRKMADDVLAHAPTDVVLDLSRARCDVTTVPVLALLRRYAARRGVRIGLTSTSRPALALLRRSGQVDHYRVVRPAQLPRPVRRVEPAAAEAAS